MRLIIFLAAVATTAVAATNSTFSAPIRTTAAAAPVRHNTLHRLRRRGDLEHTVLTDCTRHGKNYLQVSQLAYFVGPPSDTPDQITNVTTDRLQAWAGSGKMTIISFKNIAFSVEIPTTVADGQFAGSGHNGFAAFSCYARFKKELYKTKEGLVCDQIYDCDHTTPPPVTSTTSSSPTTSATETSTPSRTDTSFAQPTGPPGPAPASDGSLSLGAELGIAFGAATFTALVSILAWLFPCRRNDRGERGAPVYRYSHVVTNYTGISHSMENLAGRGQTNNTGNSYRMENNTGRTQNVYINNHHGDVR